MSGSYGVGPWKYIRGWDTYVANTNFIVGNIMKVKFWHNVWCGDRALKEVYLQVYGLARRKETSITDLLIITNGLPQLNVTFLKSNIISQCMLFHYFSHIH